jgi:serine protease Do
MVRQVAPTVVTVLSSRTVRNQDVPDDPMLRRFFGLGEAPAGDRVQHGLGSGVIVRADGYILTNNHVVEDADELTVGFADGGEPIAAKVVGTDPKTDLAVLKIDPGSRHLAPIQLGDSDQVEVGEAAFAIGNPFGVGQTVTMGIVSAVGRTVDADQATYQDFLQTDASINPGNSGGALVDSNGRLIGINTAIISPTGTNLGIGFAIPVNLAHAVMDSIIAHGKVVRGFLGVVIQPLTPDLAKALKMPGADAPGAEAKGALVSDVTADGPAAKAGIKAEDVIVKMDQAAVDDPRHLRLMIAAHAPGAQVTLTVIRDGAEVVVPVTLADLPADAGKPGGKHAKAEAHKEELGVAIEDIDDHARKRYDLPDDLAGAVITQVKPESKAAEAGLKPGQVIIAIDRKPVASAQEASDAIDRNPGDLLLRVWNDGARLYIVVRR